MIERTSLRELIQKYFSDSSDDQITMLAEALGKELDKHKFINLAENAILRKSDNLH